MEKFLRYYQTVYLEQTYTRLLNLADNHYWHYFNEHYFSNLKMWHIFTIFVFGYFIYSASKLFHCLRRWKFKTISILILNVTLFSILFTYICTDSTQYFLHAFLKYIQNNVEYLIQNTIHLAIQIYHSMLVLIF